MLNRGQVILRHTKGPPYRCFLPDLAGFESFCCAGPGPLSSLQPTSALSIIRPSGRTSPGKGAVPAAPGWVGVMVWRRGWDLNPRSPCEDNGFRDRPNRPLSHLSNVPFTLHANYLRCFFAFISQALQRDAS